MKKRSSSTFQSIAKLTATEAFNWIEHILEDETQEFTPSSVSVCAIVTNEIGRTVKKGITVKKRKKIIPSKTTPFSHFRQKQKKSSQLFRSLRSRPPTRTRFTGLGKYTTNGQLNVLQCSFRTTRLKKKTFLRFICWLKFLIEHSFAGLWLRIIDSRLYQSTSPARFVKMAKSGKVTAVFSQMNNSDGRNKKDNLF